MHSEDASPIFINSITLLLLTLLLLLVSSVHSLFKRARLRRLSFKFHQACITRPVFFFSLSLPPVHPITRKSVTHHRTQLLSKRGGGESN